MWVSVILFLASANVITGSFNDETIKSLEFLHSPRFTFMDMNSDGILTSDEISVKYTSYMKNRGRFCGLDFVCDVNKDGKVTRTENTMCIVQFFNQTIFPMLDTDSNGVISGAEQTNIVTLTQEYFYHLTAKEIGWVVQYCDVNMNGEMDLSEMLHVDGELTNIDLMRLKFASAP